VTSAGLYRFFAFTAICLSLWNISAYAQYSSEDSVKIEKIIKDAKKYADPEPEKARQIINQAIELSKLKNYKAGLAGSYNVMGSVYERIPDSKKAIQYYSMALQIAREENLEALQAIILYNSASEYEDIGDYDKAFKIITEALALKRKLNDSLGIARSYKQIAQHLSYKKDYVSSINYFQKALTIHRKLNSTHNIAVTLNSMGVVYTSVKQYRRGLAALQEAIMIAKEEEDSLFMEGIFLNIGFCYDGMGKLDSAEHYYLRSLVMSDLLDEKTDKPIVLNNLGELYFQQGRLDLSETYLLRGLVSARANNSLIDLRDIQNNLSELYARKNDFRNAYFYQEGFVRAADSMMNEEKMKALEELTVRFETKEVEEKNILLQKENDLQKSRLQQRNYLMLAILVFAVLLVTIIFLYTRQKRFRLQKEKLDIEQKLLQIQMNPHFIFNSLQAIQSFILTNRQKESAGYLTSFSRLMRLILENSKHDLISLDKEADTLAYYLELQQLRFKGVFTYAIHIDPAIDKDFMLVPPMLLQPFIENAIEHGFKNMKEPGLLKVEISQTKNGLLFEVSDNGMGIERSKQFKQENRRHRSYALEIIRKRIEVINESLRTAISLSIEDLSQSSSQQQGTRVKLYIPTTQKSKS
jgi:tetratricopeptide (TPR) repeat protein